MLNSGEKAPFFELKNQNDELISLDHFSGRKIVVYFYPKDDTPGCTKEALGFTEFLKEFESKNTAIVGVSKDSVSAHQKFCSKYNLEHMLLSDPSCEMIQHYGAWQEKSMYGKKYMGIQRSTILIDENGIVTKVWPKVKVPGHVEDVLASID